MSKGTVSWQGKRDLNQLESYLKGAHRLPYDVCIWPESVNHTFCGQSANFPKQSPNGLKLVMDVWPD